MKECFFFLLNSNSIFIAVFHHKLWFSGIDNNRFHKIFYFYVLLVAHFSRFLVLSHYQLLTVHISHYWRSKQCTINNFKTLKEKDPGFNGFHSTFSKNLFELF